MTPVSIVVNDYYLEIPKMLHFSEIQVHVLLILPVGTEMCHDYLEISEMLSLPEMREAGDPLVGVGHGVAASTSSVGGVVVRHLTAVSETGWTGINYRSLQYIYRY